MTILNFLGFVRFSFVDILDIIVVAAILYFLFKWLKGSSAKNILVAIVLLVLLRVGAAALNMKMLSAIMGTLIDLGAIALVVIFQPEIRQFLSRLGRSAAINGGRFSFVQRLFRHQGTEMQIDEINELCEACIEMAAQKTGSLIVILRKDPLQDIISTGDRLDANVRTRLIENVFFKNSPLHDGAMVIGGGRIIAARCTLPITDRSDIPAHFGMRHKSAIGISERSDAMVIVTSEQTGKISFVSGGNIVPVGGKSALKSLLLDNNKEIEE